MEKIQVVNLTKDYGNNKGVFDISFTVRQGEVMGFLGPNGAGKTTTIRQLMGFIKPDLGNALILDKDCFFDACKIHKNIGYVPGEISFMDEMSGIEFINFIAKSKGITDLTYAHELILYFELDAQDKIKKMSKGTKQKIALVCAFMDNPDIYILDEPTSGLDPLMQNKFIDLILEKKSQGKTFLISSHIFEEIERTSDRVAIIKEGKIVAIDDVVTLTKSKTKTFTVFFKDRAELQQCLKKFPTSKTNGLQLEISSDNLKMVFLALSKYEIVDIDIKKQTLEELFLHYYGGIKHD